MASPEARFLLLSLSPSPVSLTCLLLLLLSLSHSPVSLSPVSPQRLKHTESDRLQVQIQAYLDNVFDVGTLLEDAETKTAALERVEELEENLGTVRQTAGETDRW